MRIALAVALAMAASTIGETKLGAGVTLDQATPITRGHRQAGGLCRQNDSD